jgi:DNA-binding phage protein
MSCGKENPTMGRQLHHSKEWRYGNKDLWMNADKADIMDYFLDGKEDKAKQMMRDLINEDMGFESMALKTGIHSKSIHRMLSAKGNPTARNLFLILRNL